MRDSLLMVDTGTAGVRAAFTTRHGGVSSGPYASLNLGATTGDDAEAVRGNRMALAQGMEFDPMRAVTMRQVHGARVEQAAASGGDGTFTGDLDGLWDADACVTRHPGVALLALGADCPVIVAWRRDGAAVAAIHAGWRGLVAGAVQAGIAALDAPDGAVGAIVGPHVGPCCYPVDAGLRRQMGSVFGVDVVRGDAVDLGLCAARALERSGVPGPLQGRAGGCTSCDAGRFFSYRRDGARTGRQAAVVMIDEAP